MNYQEKINELSTIVDEDKFKQLKLEILNNVVHKLRKIQGEKLNSYFHKENLIKDLKKLEAVEEKKINEAVDTKGKKLYSNQNSRASALLIELNKNNDYNKMRNQIVEIEEKISFINADREYLENIIKMLLEIG